MRWAQLAVGLLVVALVAQTATAQSTVVNGEPDISVSVDTNRYIQGEDTTLTLTLNNAGDINSGSASNPSLNDEVTTARATTVDLKANGAPVEIKTAKQNIGQVSTSQPRDVPFEISVADDAEPGTYQMEATVRYTYYSSITNSESGSQTRSTETRRRTYDVTLRVIDRARFEVVDVESDVQVGTSGTVAVTMENTGTEAASDASVTLNSQNSDLTLGESSSGTRYVGAWAAGERQTVEYRVTASDNAEQQRYAFTADVTFEDSDGVSYTASGFSLGVVPDPETSFELRNVTSSLNVGEEGTITGTITNTADVPARDVVVRFATEAENISPNQREYSVGTLAPGESADFEFSTDVSDGATQGPRQFTFVADYRDQDGDQRSSDDLLTRQEIGPETSVFDVRVVEGTVENGASSTYQVEITNTRDETLTDISAKMFADSPIGVSDSEGFVRQLDPGESATLNFTVSASGATPKTYPVSIDFEYNDGDGDTQLSDRYRRPVEVREPSNGGGGFPLALIGVGVVVVVAIGGYMRFR